MWELKTQTDEQRWCQKVLGKQTKAVPNYRKNDMESMLGGSLEFQKSFGLPTTPVPTPQMCINQQSPGKAEVKGISGESSGFRAKGVRVRLSNGFEASFFPAFTY
ncbi:hypothetical protein CEXT_772461 [Caerostris extrusa]|uniref:Uncharacterized protein n=1 Tax=Caerostris extrusa TaxID=172846 RepID=A0AAV4P0Z3_CAEEX|nr:hypothetical protein CEXT_772461 [Caerostris extrusa]